MIPRLPFGKTGHESTRTIFGAAALARVATDEEAAPVLELVLEHRINHIDTAAMYGYSERRLAPWLASHRDKFFLATKTHERTYEKARDQFHHSLERMRVDSVDLLQLHNLVEPDEWETAMGPGGALEAAVEAREQGRVRFIGVTGHGVTVAKMHKRSLERFPFDSVLLPYNYTMMQNPQYAADFVELERTCIERGVAMQTIKGITLGPWNEKEHTHDTWYEPLEDPADIARAVHWVLGRPNVFLNTAATIPLLSAILDAAARFDSTPSDAAMEEMLSARGMTPMFV
ncbi:MAG: aldo/keto reductase [Dehalococcoidia bacterium]